MDSRRSTSSEVVLFDVDRLSTSTSDCRKLIVVEKSVRFDTSGLSAVLESNHQVIVIDSLTSIFTSDVDTLIEPNLFDYRPFRFDKRHTTKYARRGDPKPNWLDEKRHESLGKSSLHARNGFSQACRIPCYRGVRTR